MSQRTNDLLNTTGLTGNLTGDWCAMPAGPEYILVQVSLPTGTGTVNIEGRVSADHGAVPITSYTATDGDRVLRFPEMRARVASAVGATIRVGTSEQIVDPLL